MSAQLDHLNATADAVLVAVVVTGLLLVFFAAAAYVRGMRR